VRDREAAVIKSNLGAIGIAVELQPVDSAVLFGRPDAADSAPRFEADLQLYSNGASAPDAQGYLESLTSAHIPQRANNWDGFNMMRWSNPTYDQIVDMTATTRDPAQRIALFEQADTILVGDGAQIPLVARTALAAHVAGLQGVNRVAWDSDVWNIAHWIRR
jgi:peptide/nickel transport system substrate-binding protein